MRYRIVRLYISWEYLLGNHHHIAASLQHLTSHKSQVATPSRYLYFTIKRNLVQPPTMSSTITTPISPTIQPSTLIATLHNHDIMIKALCPGLISYAFISGDKTSEATYSVTDKKPIGQVHPPFFSFPLPLFSTFPDISQTTYRLTLTNVTSGIDSLVNAKPPVGTLTIAAKWRVAGGELVEEVEIDGNFMMKKMAKGNVEKTHPEQHSRLLEMARA